MLFLFALYVRIIHDLAVRLPHLSNITLLAQDSDPTEPTTIFHPRPQAFLYLQAEVQNFTSSIVLGHCIITPGNLGLQFLQPHHSHCVRQRRILPIPLGISPGELTRDLSRHPMVGTPQGI